MDIIAILQKIRSSGVRLYLVNGSTLQIEVKKPLTAEQETFLRNHEENLVEHLKSGLPRHPSNFIALLPQREVFDIDEVVDEMCFIVNYYEIQQPTLGKTWREFFERFIELGSRAKENFQYLTVELTAQLMDQALSFDTNLENQ